MRSGEPRRHRHEVLDVMREPAPAREAIEDPSEERPKRFVGLVLVR
jgi:hypothetical protein